MKKTIFILILVIIISSCNDQSRTESTKIFSEFKPIDKLHWLLGTWSNITSESQLFEIWTKENDSIYSGISYMLVKNDTAFYETIKLISVGQDLFYIPTINDQNDEQPVSFKLISEINKKFIFENKNHDFPQRIIYNNSEPNVLNARTEGIEEGRFHKEEFILKRSSKFP